MRSMNVRIVWGLAVVVFTSYPFWAAAQPKTQVVMTSARSVDTAISKPVVTAAEPVSTATEAAGNVNILPLFGEQAKTPEQIDADIRFLNDCDQNFASRAEASQFFSARGWDYVSEGQLDTAAYRFNLAYLLSDKNADAFWGLGVVCYQKNQFRDAVRMLKRGLAVADTNATLMTDLATVQIKHYAETKDEDELNEAETLLQHAVSISPSNANAYMKLSLVHYTRADYAKAWEHFHRARLFDMSVIDFTYLNELISKMPDPQKVFR